MKAHSLDIEQPDQLIAYLRDTGRIDPSEEPAIRNLRGGVSNRTVFVERPSGEAWVLKQALAQLRVEVEWFSSPERIHREALGMRWLRKLAPPGTITELLFEDHDQHLLAMSAVHQPHYNWKDLLMRGELETRHIQQFGGLLGAIHRAAYQERDELCGVFGDRSFFESLRVEPYYVYTASQVPEVAGFYQDLIEEMRGCRLTLVHGDYSPKNILIHQDRMVLLDHEVIHFGDPAFDLGFSLTHLLSKAHHLPDHRVEFAGAAALYWREYRGSVGTVEWADALEARAVRHTLGCLLARVCGRSTLEYLNRTERNRQRRAVTEIMQAPPETVRELVNRFVDGLERYA